MKSESLNQIVMAAEAFGGIDKISSLRELFGDVIYPIKDSLCDDDFLKFFYMVYTASYYDGDITYALHLCDDFPIKNLIPFLEIYEQRESVINLNNLLDFLGAIPIGFSERNDLYDDLMHRTGDDTEYNHEFEKTLRPCRKGLRCLDEIVLAEFTQRRFFK